MKLRMKKLHPDAVIPQYANPFDAGLDLVAISKSYDKKLKLMEFGTGLAIELPINTVGLIFPRSSIYKVPLRLTNAVGVIDAGYRGEIKFKFDYTQDRPAKNYEIGDRIGQLVVMPFFSVDPEEVEELSNSARGKGGFGSTGS